MGKTILITGASSGFGPSLARSAAHHGYDVILHGRDRARLGVLHDEIAQKYSKDSFIVAADLSTQDGVRVVADAIRAKNVSILFNNAAINPELTGESVLDTPESIGDVIAVNVTSAIALCRVTFRQFVVVGGGTIININSIAGLRGSAHEPTYAASKFALRGFSESVKEDWLKQGVKMIDVYVGAIGTGMSAHRSDIKDLIDPEELANYLVGALDTKSFFVKELQIRRTNV